jgi:hypothetical protein
MTTTEPARGQGVIDAEHCCPKPSLRALFAQHREEDRQAVRGRPARLRGAAGRAGRPRPARAARPAGRRPVGDVVRLRCRARCTATTAPTPTQYRPPGPRALAVPAGRAAVPGADRGLAGRSRTPAPWCCSGHRHRQDPRRRRRRLRGRRAGRAHPVHLPAGLPAGAAAGRHGQPDRVPRAIRRDVAAGPRRPGRGDRGRHPVRPAGDRRAAGRAAARGPPADHHHQPDARCAGRRVR